VLTMNSVKILHAVRSAITATAELLVMLLPGEGGGNATSRLIALYKCVKYSY